MSKIKEIEKENVALRGCVDSALMTLADYDGCREAEDLMELIDDVVGTLQSGYPDRMVDFKGRETCPLCFQRLKKVRDMSKIKAEMDFSEDWYELTEEERRKYAEEQNKEYDEYVKWYNNLSSEELEKQNEELREFRYRHDI